MKWLLKFPWWVYLVVVDLFFVILSTIFHYLPDSTPYKWSLIYHLNLGTEMSLATWWSAMSLLLLAFMAYELSWKNVKQRNPWLILAFMFGVLSFDELGSLHERLINQLGDSTYVLIALVGGILVFYILVKFWGFQDMRRTTFLLIIGFALMASIAPQEYLEHRIRWPKEFLGLRLGFEEGVELAGILFCFAALVSQCRLPSKTFSCLVPNPAIALQRKYLPWLILVIQVLISVLVLNYFETRAVDGNPAVWIPSALFFFLFVLSVWNWINSPKEGEIIWGLIALLSLFLSLAILYTLSIRETSVLNSFGFLIQFSQLALISLPLYFAGFVLLEKTFDKTIYFLFLSAIAVGLMIAFQSHMMLMYVMSATYALTITTIFLTATISDDLNYGTDKYN